MNLRQISILVVTSFILYFGSSPSLASELKSITRVEDPVVVEGRNLKDLIGVNPDNLALMMYDSGEFKPIPFQIDQKHENGQYAYRCGKQASKDTNPDLDKNDELVFMINDLGDKAPKGNLPKGAGRGMELEVIDPNNQNKGWAYLFRYKNKPPCSNIDYINMEINTDENYKRVYGKDLNGQKIMVNFVLNELVPNEIRFINKDGSSSPDFLDLIKIRGKIKFKGLFFPVNLKLDRLINEKLVAWTDGPVRILYFGDSYAKASFIKIRGYVTNYLTAYRRQVNAKVDFGIPININTLIKEMPIRGYMDFNENTCGLDYQVYTEANKPTANILLDGKTSNNEKKIDFNKYCDWIAANGPYGGIIFRIIFPKDKAWNHVKKTFYLKEDLATPEPPEDNPGELAVGLDFKGIGSVHSNHGLFDIYFYVMNDFKIGDEKDIINILNNPIEVRCAPYH